MRCLFALILVWGLAGCGAINTSSKVEPLAAVAPLATPKLPNWIEQISPKGEAEPLAQILIRFKEPVIPIESLDSSEQQAKLKLFEIQPQIPGQFRFLTPRMVGFQPEQALPKATRVKVTLKAGLADLKNNQLAEDLAWTFNTEPVKLTNLPSTEKTEYNEPSPLDVKPTLKFTSNVELDLASVPDRVSLIPQGEKTGVAFDFALEKSDDAKQPQEKFDPSLREWNYTIVPRQELKKGTRYRLEFAPGLRPVRGNMPSDRAFVSQVTTYAPLAFEGIKYFGQPDAGGAYGRFVKGSAELKFNNGLDAESAIANITVTPAPKKEPRLVRAYDGEKAVSLNPWSLDPKTTYTINIGADLKDKFGQALGKPISLKYETGDVAADIWAPAGLNIFPAGNDLQLNISAVNLPESKYQAAYKVVQPTDLVYADSAYPREKGTNLLPKSESWESFRVSGKKNQPAELTIPLQQKLGAPTGMLAYGIEARTNRYQENKKEQWREPAFYGLVQLTNLGVFAQWFPDSGLIRVHHLSDGSAVAAAPVEIYQSQLQAKAQPNPKPCAAGKTDNTGTLLLSDRNWQQCLNGSEQAPELLVIAREGKDWAFSRTNEYSGAYDYGIYASWDDGKPQSRGEIFSDRQLYQPGEKAWFTGVAYYLQNGGLKQDKNARYAVTLESPDGSKTDLGSQTTNEFGTFSLELPLAKNQPLGYYFLRAKGTNGVEISGSFRVAEFKPPNFKVALSLDKEFALVNDKVEAKAESTYLFGSPVEAGQAKYYVTRRKTEFSPKGWDKFSFGRQWFWPENEPSISSDVLQQNAVLDASGKGSQTVTVAKDLPYPMVYRFDVEVSDVSNLSVADSKTFTALPSDRFIGLQSNFVADANKAFPVEVVVTDTAGNAIAGDRVVVELQKMDYSRVTQVVEGSQSDRNQVEYKTVAKAEIKSATTPQTVSLTPPESGAYRIRANFAGKDEVTATDLQIWATGESAVSWGRRSDDNYLEIKLDKETYKPGETATALIQSPYPEAELYFAVVRDKILYQTVTKVKGGAPQIQFNVTPEMLPNAAVEAVLVRQGAPLSQVEPGSLENLAQIGFAPFQTNLDEKYLQVQITPGQTELQPGAEETVQLELKDAKGNPTQGQFTVMAVNEAVLQLSGYRLPDLVKTVYAEQPISTRLADNRADVVLEPLASPLEKGWGYGGGLSAGAANTRTRTNFQPLAYYNGSVIADDRGKAQVKFKVPDDLTTWRVMAVAATADMRFGNGENTFITTQPLLSNPVLPQFARPGDRLEAGLSVTNNTKQTGNLAINGEVKGAVKFDNNQTRQTLQAKAESGTRAYRFPMVAESKGEGKVKFVTKLDSGASDAFEVPLTVKPLEVTEQVVETGTTTNLVKIPLDVNKNVSPDAGGLEISLASTLIPEITVPARQVLDDDDLPFLEPAASQLAIAASLQTLGKQYKQTFANFNPTQQAAQSIERLQKLQQPDGGFAYFPGETTSDPFVTPYAAQSLALAKAAGLPVDSVMLSRLTTYLQNILANPGQYEPCNRELCKGQVRLDALMALAELGNKRNDFLADIYAQRDNFDAVTKIKLARYLSQFPDWVDESKALFAKLQETTYETGRSAAVNLPRGWSWLSSPATAQAQTLRLAIAQKVKPEVSDRLLQGLLNLRREGTWGNTYDNAEALVALVDYSKTQPVPPDFITTVKLADKRLDSARFKGYENPSVSVNVGMTELPRGKNDLIVQKSGNGTLHYLVAYRYRLQGNQPGRFNGLRVAREIRPASEEKLLQRIGLSADGKPLTVNAGQVFDIGLEIVADRPVDRVVITDNLPAGFEAVDASFQTSTQAVQAQASSWQIGYQTIYRDRVVAYSDRLEPGVYNMHYLVRSVTPGTYLWPGAEVHLQYAPEEFGRSASSTLVVKE